MSEFSKIRVSQLNQDDLGVFVQSYIDVYEPPRHLFLAIRDDGKEGVGNVSNPLDVSTVAKFDAILSRNLTDIVIHLGPGTYLTHGCKWGERGLRAGVKIIGSGRGQTIVKMAPTWTHADASYSSNYLSAIFAVFTDGDVYETYKGIEIRHLTLDCNAQNLVGLSGKGINGTYLFSHYGVIDDVDVLNSSDVMDVSNIESFPITLFGKNTLYRDIRCYGHIRTTTGTNTGHTMITNPGKDARFVRCVVDLSASTGAGYSHAFGSSGKSSFKDCVIIGAPDGYTSTWFGDTPLIDDEQHMTVDTCQAYNVVQGFVCNTMKFNYVHFKNNYIQLSTAADATYGAGFVVAYPGAALRHSFISQNIFDHVGTPANARGIAFFDNSPTNVQILNNTFKVGLINYMTDPSSQLWMLGNRFMDGTVPLNTYNSNNMGFHMPGVTVP